jgi:hypothetical protein
MNTGFRLKKLKEEYYLEITCANGKGKGKATPLHALRVTGG